MVIKLVSIGLFLCRYCAIKLTKDWIDQLDDKHDSCYVATLLEWNTYQALHKPRQAQSSTSKALLQETNKRKMSCVGESSGQHIPGHGAGHVSPD